MPLKYRLIFNPVVNAWIRKMERMTYPYADRITVCKEEFKQYLIDNYQVSPDKFVMIKYGLDPAMFTPELNWENKERRVIFVGRGSVGKGFDTLVEAAPLIKGEVLAIASRVPKFLLEKITRLKNFKLMSGIPPEQLVGLYKQSMVFTLPSLSEGSPLSTLEAMACGLPAVCTVEGSSGYIEDGVNGYIVPFRDPIALAGKINELLDSPETMRRFGELNREIFEKKYTIPIIAEQTINVYRELLN